VGGVRDTGLRLFFRVGRLRGLLDGSLRRGVRDNLLDRSGRRNDGLLVGDTELVGVLVEAGFDLDQLDAIVGDVILQGGRGSPLVGTGVRNILNNGVHGDDIG